MRNDTPRFQQPRRKFLQNSSAMAGSLLLPLAACAQSPKESSPSHLPSLVPPGYKLAFEKTISPIPT